jgi:1-acyl-sn-glycerol-3-phosphate acyltransferase
MGSPLLAAIRLVSYLALTLLLIPVQVVLVRCDRSRAKRFARFYHRLCLRLLGFTVRIAGVPVPGRPTLFISNHASYLDIIVLGSVIEGSFVAKSEVSGWPLFGLLAKLQRTVFIDRQRRSTAAQRDGITGRLSQGDDLMLFPEGTSSDGIHVLPFKSALFSVADREVGGVPLTVQPISLAYVQLDGAPLGRALMPFFAWYGDMSLAAHLWRVAGLGHATIELTFHPPVTLAELGSRKALALHCEAVVARGVAASLAGRRAPPHMTTQAGAAPKSTAIIPQQDPSNHTVLDRAPTDARVQ